MSCEYTSIYIRVPRDIDIHKFENTIALNRQNEPCGGTHFIKYMAWYVVFVYLIIFNNSESYQMIFKNNE